MHYRTAQLHKETVLVIRLHDSPRSATGRLLQLPRKSGMTSRNATSESGGEGPVRAGSAGSATPAEVRKVNNPVRAAFSARVCSGQNSHWRRDLFIGSEFGHFLPVVWPSIRCCDASLMWDCQPIKWIFFRPNQKFSHNKTKTKHNLPHEKKNRPPRGFGSTPAHSRCTRQQVLSCRERVATARQIVIRIIRRTAGCRSNWHTDNVEGVFAR